MWLQPVARGQSEMAHGQHRATPRCGRRAPSSGSSSGPRASLGKGTPMPWGPGLSRLGDAVLRCRGRGKRSGTASHRSIVPGYLVKQGQIGATGPRSNMGHNDSDLARNRRRVGIGAPHCGLQRQTRTGAGRPSLSSERLKSSMDNSWGDVGCACAVACCPDG